MDKQTKKNAYLYCKYRDDQFASYDQYVKKQGMTMNTFLVFNALYYANDGLTQLQLCKMTRQSKQTISLIVKKLKKASYIHIQNNPHDLRSQIITLNDTGRNYCKEAVEHITRAEDEAMLLLTKEEQELLISLSKKFTQQLLTKVSEHYDY